ncbi:ribonuclease P protein component [Neotabrizicola sp. VNH66]|uniref:ribonuclease P protein component n=1 Tax=Neotabrizicola sp. VNH66 TaxID=3400918 RepID=UPI003C11F3E2
MTPPEAQGTRHDAEAPEAPPAVSVCPTPTAKPLQPARYVRHGVLNVLPVRADFLKAASARRQGTASFLLQARDRRDGDPVVRVGFTASKKVGNAVIRARAKRRLRSLAREMLPALGQPGWDYVLVARPEATTLRPYAQMLDDLAAAFASVHRPPRERAPRENSAREEPRRTEGSAPRGASA